MTKANCCAWLNDFLEVIQGLGWLPFRVFWGTFWGLCSLTPPPPPNTHNCPRIMFKSRLFIWSPLFSMGQYWVVNVSFTFGTENLLSKSVSYQINQLKICHNQVWAYLPFGLTYFGNTYSYLFTRILTSKVWSSKIRNIFLRYFI